MAEKTNPKDPRFRRYRAFMYGLYIVVTVTVCAHLIISVSRSTWRMTFGGETAEPAVPLTVKECVDGAQGLFGALESQRKLMSDPKVSDADQRWLDFRGGWMKRFRELEGKCALKGQSRENVKEIFQLVEKVGDLYMTHAVQFAGESGPTVDKLRERLAQMRSDPAMGRLP